MTDEHVSFLEEIKNFKINFGTNPKIFITGNFAFAPGVTRLCGVRIYRDYWLGADVGYFIDLEKLKSLNRMRRLYKTKELSWI